IEYEVHGRNVPADTDRLAAAMSQSWQLKSVESAIGRCNAILSVAVRIPEAVSGAERLSVLQHVIAAVNDTAPSEVIHWFSSQQVIATEMFVSECREDGIGTLYAGALNVRLFRMADSGPGRVLMDTLGLEAFDLPDLQCDFQGLQPAVVARTLFST